MSTTNQLADLLAHRPTPRDSRSLRVRWLFEMAATLDQTPIDGAADLATTARELALALITETVTCIGRVAA